MQNLVNNCKVDNLDEDALFGNSVAAFLKKKLNGKKKNKINKAVHIYFNDNL